MNEHDNRARIWSLFDLGRVQRAAMASAIFRLQVQFAPVGAAGALQVADPVRYIQHFGFASLPPQNADVAVFHLKGDRSNAIALGSNHQQHRPPTGMQTGDSALYDVRDAYAWFGAEGLVIDAAGGNVTIQNAAQVTVTATTKVTLSAASIEVVGSLTINGSVDVEGTLHATGEIASDVNLSDGVSTLASVRSAYDHHAHTGVATGSGTSGPTTISV